MNCEDNKIVSVDNPVECIIEERINRFVVKVIVDREPHRAYIANTGRLLGYLVKGKKGFCVRTGRKGKTDCRLFAIKENSFGAIVDTQLQMRFFERALEMKLIPWLKQCEILRRNAKLGRSLIDYLLECVGDRVYLEVKSAVLRDGRYAMYPDCPSSRGRKHIEQLGHYVREGGRGIILFIAALPEVRTFKPNKSADPEMHKLLQEAYGLGVDLKSIGMYYNPEDTIVYLFNPDLEIDLWH